MRFWPQLASWDLCPLGLSVRVPKAVQNQEPLRHPERALGEAFVFQPCLPLLDLTHTGDTGANITYRATFSVSFSSCHWAYQHMGGIQSGVNTQGCWEHTLLWCPFAFSF